MDVQEEEFLTGHQRHGSVHLLTQLPYCFWTKYLQCVTFSGNCQSLWMSKFLASNDKDSLVCRSPVLAMALGGAPPNRTAYGHVREVSWGDQELFQRKIQGWVNSSVDKELGLLA